MKTFEYVAVAADGVLREGKTWAEDEVDLDRDLESDGLTLTRCKVVGGDRGARKLKIKRDELINLTNQLSTVTSAGVRIVDGLEGIGRRLQSESGRDLVEEMVGGLRSGLSLSQVLDRHPKSFPEVYRASVRAGESSGALDKVLTRMSGFLEWSRTMRATTMQAMTYPAILMTAILGLVLVLMNFVLPRLVTMFPGGEEDLPMQTKIVLGASAFMRSNALGLVLGVGATVGIFLKVRSTERGREIWHRALIKVPKFGTVLRQISTARFASTASTLQKAGCDVFEMIGTAGATCGNAALEAAFRRTMEGVRQGMTITQGLEREPLIDPLLIQMIDVGEKTGQLDICLSRLAEYYDAEVPRVVKRFLGFLEPAMLLAAAGIVGFILMAALMPIFKLYDSLG